MLKRFALLAVLGMAACSESPTAVPSTAPQLSQSQAPQDKEVTQHVGKTLIAYKFKAGELRSWKVTSEDGALTFAAFQDGVTFFNRHGKLVASGHPDFAQHVASQVALLCGGSSPCVGGTTASLARIAGVGPSLVISPPQCEIRAMDDGPPPYFDENQCWQFEVMYGASVVALGAATYACLTSLIACAFLPSAMKQVTDASWDMDQCYCRFGYWQPRYAEVKCAP